MNIEIKDPVALIAEISYVNGVLYQRIEDMKELRYVNALVAEIASKLKGNNK